MFVTFTANITWDLIQKELLPGDTVQHIPHVVNRIFYRKLKFLLEEGIYITYYIILNLHTTLFRFSISPGLEMIFGKIIWLMVVVEFQARGLPHAHIVFK